MNDQEIDLIKEVDELAAKAKSIDEVAKLYKNRINELQSQIQFSELSVKEAEERAGSAEALAQKAKEQYQKAIALKDGQYEQLIHDLFEAPQKKLVGHMELQSRKSNTRTVSIAIVSIIISMIVSVYFQRLNSIATNDLIAKMDRNSTSTNDLIAKMDRTMNSLQTIEGKTETVMEDIWLSDPNVKTIVQVISEAKKDFANYETKNDVALAYKITISSKIPNARYSDCLKAFRVAGISKENIPTNEHELSQWDAEYSQLCGKAIRYLKNYDSSLVLDNEREFANYKTESDETDYLGWSYSQPNLTRAALRGTFQGELDAVQKRINLNK